MRDRRIAAMRARIINPLLGMAFAMLPLATALPADRLPPVYLTHFFVTLDQASYDALRTSPQVAALAATSENHVVAGSRNWTGTYIWGRQTYIELVGAAALPDGMYMGQTGLALTVEEQGGVAAVAKRLRTAFGDKMETKNTVSTEATGDIPWFSSVDNKDDDSAPISTWFMGIDPGYPAASHPELHFKNPLSREEYLQRKFLPDHPLDNIVGLTAALNPANASRLGTELELAGWTVQRGSGGFVATGPDIKFTVVPAKAREGIQQAELSLRHPVPEQRIELGSTELLLKGNTGRFIFWK